MYLLYIVGRYTLQCKQENLSLIGLILENKKKRAKPPMKCKLIIPK